MRRIDYVPPFDLAILPCQKITLGVYFLTEAKFMKPMQLVFKFTTEIHIDPFDYCHQYAAFGWGSAYYSVDY